MAARCSDPLQRRAEIEDSMSSRWSFFAFDWTGYRAAEAALELACSEGDFTQLEIEAADEILAGFDETASAGTVCNALVREMFGQGEALFMESGLLEMIRELRRQSGGEEVADMLSELISAEPNVQCWFSTESGLVGLFTEAQTRQLHAAFDRFQAAFRPERARGFAAISRLFSTTSPAFDRLGDLMDLIRSAVNAGQGLAAVRHL